MCQDQIAARYLGLYPYASPEYLRKPPVLPVLTWLPTFVIWDRGIVSASGRSRDLCPSTQAPWLAGLHSFHRG